MREHSMMASNIELEQKSKKKLMNQIGDTRVLQVLEFLRKFCYKQQILVILYTTR